MRTAFATAVLATLALLASDALAFSVTAPPAQRLLSAPLIVRGRVIEKLSGEQVPVKEAPYMGGGAVAEVAKISVEAVLKGDFRRAVLLVRDVPRSVEWRGVKVNKGQHVLLFLRESYDGYRYAVHADGAVDLDESPGWLELARATLALVDQEPDNDQEARAHILSNLRRFERLSEEMKIFALSIVFGRFEKPELLISPPDELLISVLRQSRDEPSIEIRRLAVRVAAWRVKHRNGALRDALVGHVIAALEDDAPTVRAAALRSLHRNLEPAAMKQVVLEYAPAMLEDPSSSVRAWATHSLQQLRYGVVSEEGRQGFDPRLPPEQQREAIEAWRAWARKQIQSRPEGER